MSAALQILRVADATGRPWQNGGGSTRELLVWPPDAAATGWQLRISVADIERDGPFSSFAGVQRWFAVLQGAGVLLHFKEHTSHIPLGVDAYFFQGEAAPGCTLIDGPTVDLNLMLRAGSGHMRRCTAGEPFTATAAQLGLFTTGGGTLHAGSVHHAAPPMSLIWCAAVPPLGAWRFDPAAHGPSYWIGFTPQPKDLP